MIDITKNGILLDVARYYTEKIGQHGTTPLGVDWNGAEGQLLRFEQLCKIITSSNRISINDLGCGYGALFDYLSLTQKNTISYSGIDISDEMIRMARQRFHNNIYTRFLLSSEPDQLADYGIASGIFNVRLDKSDAEWLDYLKSTLDVLDRTSRIGFSFNCLTSYSDKDKTRDYLYYADPCVLFDLCKRRYSHNVALLHDYGLFEFTILVRKLL